MEKQWILPAVDFLNVAIFFLKNLFVEIDIFIHIQQIIILSFVTFSERKKGPVTPIKDDEREERWPLKQVVFVEDVKTVQLGRVLKVDGTCAAVRFLREGDSSAPGKDDPSALLQDCRLLRKDELQVRTNAFTC